jgi:hypothetical protein
MDTPQLPAGQEPRPVMRVLGATGKALGALLFVAAVSAGAAWGVFSYRIAQEQQNNAAQVVELREELRLRQDEMTVLRQELQQRQDELGAQMQQVQQAAQEAKLLLNQSGQTTTLDARLREIDTIKLDLKKTQDDLAAKLQSMEKSVAEQVAKQGQETAQALSLEMRWKSLVIKSQGEILLAQVHWTEGNRGLAKDELGLAVESLTQATEEAPDPVKAQLKPVLELAEQTRSALILEQSSARDSLNLLWHRVSDLLALKP